MEDKDFDVEVPLLLDQGHEYDCSQNGGEEEVESDDEDDVGVESLDYDSIHNVVHDTLLKKRHGNRRIYGYTGLTLAKWTITIMIGLLVGLIAFIIESSQEVIITYKREWTEKSLEWGMRLNFWSYAATSVALVLLSSCLVIYWAPAAAGGGVTLVMAYLNGNDIPDLFRHRTFFTKILGTICTVSSGLPIGQDGPMVHFGGAIASELTWMHGQLKPTKNLSGDEVRPPQTWREQLSQLRPKAWVFDFYNDKDRREFISAGAAAGLAAAFGAPIGGVLFSMEEASSFWSRKVMWRSLLCTTCATMVLSWLNERVDMLVILAIVLSNWVAHHIHSAGAYESDLGRIGEVHFLQSEPSQRLHLITAQDIMAPDVICFREITPVAEVMEVLRGTYHNGFPVIRHTDGDPDGQLMGIMWRHQIMLLLEQNAFFEIDSEVLHRPAIQRYSCGSRLPRLTEHKRLDRLMHLSHHSHHPLRRYLSSRPEAISELEVLLELQDLELQTANGRTSSAGSPEEGHHIKHQDVQLASHSGKELALDFRPWMNRAPLTVRAETSARRVYVIFRTLGLRHLCVTDSSNRVVGMITRKDLSKTHKDKMEVVEPDTPGDRTDYEYSQSSFGGKSLGRRSSLTHRTARDVPFSLP